MRKVLIMPATHIGKLHGLIQADYSPIMNRAEADVYFRKLHESDEQVPLDRKEFPAGYYWSIIKKWDRCWKKLRIIKRLDDYVKNLEKLWERRYWHERGGPVSPYTRQWIHYENLARQKFHEPDAKRRAELDKQFPAVAVMRRIQRGEAARAADIDALQEWVSPWCKEHVTSNAKELEKKLRLFDARQAELRKQGIDGLREQASALYAAVLAKDIQARHERVLAEVVRRWGSEWEDRVSMFFRFLGNADYIDHLLPILPLRNVCDLRSEQKNRIKAAKKASAARKASK